LVFEVLPENHDLLKANYVAYLSNARSNNAKTKTRGLVSGGGIKPHPQKGTGRARSGSTRNPIWRSGGTVFGPTGIENYTHKVHKKAKRVAIRQMLSLAVKEDRLIVIEDLVFPKNKTKAAVSLLEKIGAKGHILVIVTDKTPEITRSLANLNKVKLIQAMYLNVYDGMNADSIVMTKPALDIVSKWLGEDK
jgi:large subunit ribosomal protein L4